MPVVKGHVNSYTSIHSLLSVVNLKCKVVTAKYNIRIKLPILKSS